MARPGAQMVKCPRCKWQTSRAARADGRYGNCPACGVPLIEPTKRRFFVAATPVPRAATFAEAVERKTSEGYTWPELVALELMKRELDK